MTRPNAAMSLPPGDRDDVPPASIPPEPEPAPAIAGRDAAATGGGNAEIDTRIDRLTAQLEEAQLQLAELCMARHRGDGPSASAVVWRLTEALMANPVVQAHELRRLVLAQRREDLHREVAP